MAIDVKDRETGTDGDELDPAQQHFDDVFNDLTSQEHMAKDGVPGDTGSTEAEKEGLFNPNGEGASGEGGIPAITNRLGPNAINRLAGAFWAKQNRRRTTVAGTLIGLTLGGGILGSTFLSGPIGFMQIAHTIEQTHFASNEDASSNRLMQIYRFIKYNKTGQLHRTRMGALGNTYADRVEARLNSIGLTSEYSPLGISKTGLAIDRSAPDYRNKSADQIKQEFKEKYGLSLTENNGKLRVNTTELGFRQTRSFYKGVLRETGVNYGTSAIQAHIMGERDGVTWHPLKKLDRHVLNSVEKWWVKRAQTIENGAEPTLTTAEEQSQKDKNGKPVNQSATDSAEAIKESTQQTIDQATKSGGDAVTSDPEAVSKFSGSLSSGVAKATGITTFGIGLACMARQVAIEAPAIKEQQVNLPLIRMAMEAVTVGAQMTFGGGDVEPAELAKLSQQWYNSKTHSSWASAQPVQAAAGHKQDGPEPSDTLKSIAAGSPFDAFKNSGALGTVCNPVAQGILGVFGFLGGPVSASVSTLVGFFAEPKLLDALAHWAAGKAIDPVPLGADYGYDGMYGGRLAANEQALSQGGVELSPADEGALTTFETSSQKTDFEQQSLAYRLFSPTDIHSVMGSMLSHASPSFIYNVAAMTSSFTGVAHTLSSLPSTIFSSIAYAGTPSSYDYGIPKYGFSLNDMQQASTPGSSLENPFANGDHAAGVLETPCTKPDGTKVHPCGQDYIDAAKSCFHMTLTKDSGGEWDTQASADPINTFSDEYKNAHCTSPNNTNPNDWLSVRYFIFDTQSMKSEACYDGDPQSCADEGVASATASDSAPTNVATLNTNDLYSSSNDVKCAAGTNDLGVQDGYTNGQKVEIRICAIPNLPSTGEESNGGYGVVGANGDAVVNSRVSGAVLAMVDAANKDGVKLTANSSFRTMAHQEALCPCDGRTVAHPGYSNHQMGLAIDFGGGLTATPGPVPGNQFWDWLSKNASNFGYKNYPAEAWHWSPTGN